MDATDPGNAKVRYRLTGLPLDSVTFNAPGKTENRTNIQPGIFSFTYDQNKIRMGQSSQNINLKYGNNKKVTITATRSHFSKDISSSVGGFFFGEGLGLKFVRRKYSLSETIKVSYSIPSSGKTIYVGLAAVLIYWADFAPALRGVAVHNHQYTSNEYSSQFESMTVSSGGRFFIIRRGDKIWYKYYDLWIGKSSPKGIAKCTEMYIQSVPATPLINSVTELIIG